MLLLVLKRVGASLSVIGRTTVTWPPIRILDHQTKGWHDIAVQVHGGGIISGYEAVLTFDGDRYPSNPTIPPARPLAGNAPGQVLPDLGN